MDDVIKLVSSTYTYDTEGNPIEQISDRQVFCKVNSVSRNEFYQAAQNDLQPSYVFEISHYRDYHGEKELFYTDWTGAERRFTIIRTYRIGDRLELTAEERVDDYGN